MAKSGGKPPPKPPAKPPAKREERPTPRTSEKVKHDAGKAMQAGATARERELAASVERHIEPRKPAQRKKTP